MYGSVTDRQGEFWLELATSISDDPRCSVRRTSPAGAAAVFAVSGSTSEYGTLEAEKEQLCGAAQEVSGGGAVLQHQGRPVMRIDVGVDPSNLEMVASSMGGRRLATLEQNCGQFRIHVEKNTDGVLITACFLSLKLLPSRSA